MLVKHVFTSCLILKVFLLSAADGQQTLENAIDAEEFPLHFLPNAQMKLNIYMSLLMRESKEGIPGA